MKEYEQRLDLDKLRSRLVPNQPTPKQIQDRLDKYRDIPCKEEKRRIKRQNARRNRDK